MRFCEALNCSFPVFGTDKKTNIGYCKNHQYLRTDLDKRSIVEKAMDKNKNKKVTGKTKSSVRSLISDSNNQATTEANMGDNKILQAEMALYWFTAERELAKKPTCMECGAHIHKKYYRSATAHIFPKAIFPSVMANLANRLYLGAGCGCHDKTHRLDTFSEMKVFPLAVERFNQFKHLITEKHKYLDTFINYANGTI
jgi:hypothetical protein